MPVPSSRMSAAGGTSDCLHACHTNKVAGPAGRRAGVCLEHLVRSVGREVVTNLVHFATNGGLGGGLVVTADP